MKKPIIIKLNFDCPENYFNSRYLPLTIKLKRTGYADEPNKFENHILSIDVLSLDDVRVETEDYVIIRLSPMMSGIRYIF